MRRCCLTLVALFACHDKVPEPPPPAPPPRDGVALIQPGAPPRQALRYQLTKGARTTSRVMCDIDLTSAGERQVLPTQVLDLETTVVDVADHGAARLRIAVVDASVRDRPGQSGSSELMRAQATAMRGIVVTELLAPDGRVSDAHLETGGSDPLHRDLDGLLRILSQVAARLPSEPVGVGATWRERRTLPDGGIRAVSEITYTLTALNGTSVAFTAAGDASGAPQTVDQDGAKVEVTDTRGRSQTAGSIDLASYTLDINAASVFATTMAIVGADAGPGAERSTIEVAMKVQLGPAPAAPSPIPSGSGSGSDTGSGSGSASGSGTGSAPDIGGGDESIAPGKPAQGAHKAP